MKSPRHGVLSYGEVERITAMLVKQGTIQAGVPIPDGNQIPGVLPPAQRKKVKRR